MQAAIDGARDGGLVEAPRMATPPFLEPAHLRAGFDMNDLLVRHEQVGDALVWFAIWNRDRNLAIALDASADEVESCKHSLRSAQLAWGDHFAGPFPSRQQAEAFAVERLAAENKRRQR
jgi:hypothetical protein